MSKSKKDAYAAKQQATVSQSESRKLVALSENAPMAKTAKKATSNKKSRGK